MTSHDELVAEMASLERLSVQDRLKLARKRRAAQLKRWTASDKEFIKKSRKSGVGRLGLENIKKGRRIHFAHNIQLLEAAARGDIDEVRSLLESGVNPNIGNEDGLTALHQCCIDNNEAMMKLLVEHGADVNVTDRELWTPLHASSTCGHVNLARFLVDNGAELLAINSDGNMPYDICEDEMTLDYIESQMADKGITQEHIDGLRDVAPGRMLTDLKELKQSDQDLESRDDIGASFLHIAAANGFDKVAIFLLDNNVDVNAKDDDGWQPIHAAACWAHGEMIQLLVQYGADLDAKTNNNETPLTICEDEDLKNLINQLKAELHAHRSLESKLVRRNSSRNKRSSSIRRSSKREKGEMRKLDAKGEAMYIQSQNSTDELPATYIDEVKVDLNEPHNPMLETSPAEEVELDNEDADEINGALETDIIPLPVITEETPESPVRKGRLENGDKNASVRQNGADGEKGTGLGVSSLQRQPKSILKKRHEQEEPEDLHSKKSKRDKKETDSRKQQLEMEKQREREERERIKQHEKEEKQKEKEEREREKQRLREEKKQQQKREREEREREKHLKRKTITDENVAKKENNQVPQQDDLDKNHSGGKETLAELKRQRASEHSKRTHSGESNEEFESGGWPESGRKNSFDILKEHKNSTKQKKSPHISRKLLPLRPASGSYSFAETNANDGQRDSVASEQNGVSDGGLNSSESKSLNDSFPGDPPLKRFTATVPEVIGGDEERRCCVIL